MKPQTINLNVGSIVLATGWDIYDISKLDNLGAGKIQTLFPICRWRGLHPEWSYRREDSEAVGQ